MASMRVSDITTPPDAPKIEFPCDYPIRIMGEACEEFLTTVIAIVEQHATVQHDSIRCRDSSKGTYVSAHVIIRATGEVQLNDLHLALREYKAVKMVL